MKSTQAIVLGCGYAGMLAATVLSEHFKNVIIIERHPDIFNTPPDTTRMGIPQARHSHVLLSQGQLLINQFMPGILDEIEKNHCPQIDWAADARWHSPFGTYPQYLSDIKTFAFSRYYLDHLMIKRILKLSNVTIITGDVLELSGKKHSSTLDTVKIAISDSNQTQELPADLIVDARGRRSTISATLNQLGFKTPQAMKIANTLGYASRVYQLADQDHKDFKQFYLQVRPGKSKRGVVISPIENQRAFVTLIGLGDAKPPQDTEQFDRFLRSLPHSDLQKFLQHLKPLSDVSLCRNLHNVHYRFGSMKTWPKGLIVIGDATCILNPVYGQGMTVAAKQVLLLKENLPLLFDACTAMTWEKNFQEKIDLLLTTPWSMTTAEDLRSLTAKNLPLKLRIMHKYFDAILKLAAKNQAMHTQLTRVLHMLDKPSVFFKPKTIAKVLIHHIIGKS
jgi:2-polyprenyl-6-methoxyphenol hydroxylase-like FAD-dependent oxidoreductase